MFYLDQSRLACFDCDDTLVNWDISKYPHTEDELVQVPDDQYHWKVLPHHKNIELLKRLKAQGYGIVVWSAAGNDWARTVIQMLGIEQFVDICMSKPELAVDDLLEAKRIIKSVIWIDPITGEYKREK